MSAAPARRFPHRHLLGVEALSREDILQVLDLAETFLEVGERPIKKVPALRGRTVVNLFLEASTRTRTSFEIAAKRLSADAVTITGASLSTAKGETLVDTVRNVMAMGPDVIVLRHPSSGAAAMVARAVEAAVVNAGDGTHEHPTQALLDAATIRRHKARFEGLEVAIVGDLEHSRVARSDIHALARLGARLRVCAPRTMMPAGIDAMLGERSDQLRACHRLEEAVEGADVIMMLRIQTERLGAVGLFPNLREYARYFRLTARHLALARADALVMHPGPVQRGVEIDPEVADGPRSVILEQVRHGVAVRMAILYLLVAGGAAAPARA